MSPYGRGVAAPFVARRRLPRFACPTGAAPERRGRRHNAYGPVFLPPTHSADRNRSGTGRRASPDLVQPRSDWLSRQWEPVPQHGLIAEVAELIGSGTRAQWEARLERTETCFHPVLELEEVLTHPLTKARGLVQQSGGVDPLVEVLLPAWLNDCPPPRRRPHRDVNVAEALALW
jgi:crotonobetainyl-CoA:carnitine CoA-transferase CaiB-like acyl-CoA transferase